LNSNIHFKEENILNKSHLIKTGYMMKAGTASIRLKFSSEQMEQIK
jgi:predicted ATP-dependent protease